MSSSLLFLLGVREALCLCLCVGCLLRVVGLLSLSVAAEAKDIASELRGRV